MRFPWSFQFEDAQLEERFLAYAAPARGSVLVISIIYCTNVVGKVIFSPTKDHGDLGLGIWIARIVMGVVIFGCFVADLTLWIGHQGVKRISMLTHWRLHHYVRICMITTVAITNVINEIDFTQCAAWKYPPMSKCWTRLAALSVTSFLTVPVLAVTMNWIALFVGIVLFSEVLMYNLNVDGLPLLQPAELKFSRPFFLFGYCGCWFAAYWWRESEDRRRFLVVEQLSQLRQEAERRQIQLATTLSSVCDPTEMQALVGGSIVRLRGEQCTVIYCLIHNYVKWRQQFLPWVAVSLLDELHIAVDDLRLRLGLRRIQRQMDTIVVGFGFQSEGGHIGGSLPLAPTTPRSLGTVDSREQQATAATAQEDKDASSPSDSNSRSQSQLPTIPQEFEEFVPKDSRAKSRTLREYMRKVSDAAAKFRVHLCFGLGEGPCEMTFLPGMTLYRIVKGSAYDKARRQALGDHLTSAQLAEGSAGSLVSLYPVEDSGPTAADALREGPPSPGLGNSAMKKPVNFDGIQGNAETNERGSTEQGSPPFPSPSAPPRRVSEAVVVFDLPQAARRRTTGEVGDGNPFQVRTLDSHRDCPPGLGGPQPLAGPAQTPIDAVQTSASGSSGDFSSEAPSPATGGPTSFSPLGLAPFLASHAAHNDDEDGQDDKSFARKNPAVNLDDTRNDDGDEFGSQHLRRSSTVESLGSPLQQNSLDSQAPSLLFSWRLPPAMALYAEKTILIRAPLIHAVWFVSWVVMGVAILLTLDHTTIQKKPGKPDGFTLLVLPVVGIVVSLITVALSQVRIRLGISARWLILTTSAIHASLQMSYMARMTTAGGYTFFDLSLLHFPMVFFAATSLDGVPFPWSVVLITCMVISYLALIAQQPQSIPGILEWLWNCSMLFLFYPAMIWYRFVSTRDAFYDLRAQTSLSERAVKERTALQRAMRLFIPLYILPIVLDKLEKGKKNAVSDILGDVALLAVRFPTVLDPNTCVSTPRARNAAAATTAPVSLTGAQERLLGKVDAIIKKLCGYEEWAALDAIGEIREQIVSVECVDGDTLFVGGPLRRPRKNLTQLPLRSMAVADDWVKNSRPQELLTNGAAIILIQVMREIVKVCSFVSATLNRGDGVAVAIGSSRPTFSIEGTVRERSVALLNTMVPGQLCTTASYLRAYPFPRDSPAFGPIQEATTGPIVRLGLRELPENEAMHTVAGGKTNHPDAEVDGGDVPSPTAANPNIHDGLDNANEGGLGLSLSMSREPEEENTDEYQQQQRQEAVATSPRRMGNSQNDLAGLPTRAQRSGSQPGPLRRDIIEVIPNSGILVDLGCPLSSRIQHVGFILAFPIRFREAAKENRRRKK